MSRHFKLSVFILTFLLSALFYSPVLADGYGSISGSVTGDSTGLPLANAVVVAHKLGTFFAKNVFSDETGNYTIHELPVGNYLVGACSEGYHCELYDNTQNEESATVVVVNADQNTPN